MRLLSVLDTTLRDGEQSPGCSMNLAKKLEIADQLEQIGVDVIEAGFPIASPDDFDAVKQIAKKVKNCGVTGLCRASANDIACAWEALRHSKRPRIHIFLATSDVHIEYKLHATREKVLEMAVSSVKHARSLCGEVQFTAEDAMRSDRDFLLDVYKAVHQAGAMLVNLADTVGYASPEEMAEATRFCKANLPDTLMLGVHCHNDLGMAAANTLSAIKAGADHFECTIGGIGERAGLAAIEQVAMALKTRGDFYNAKTNLDTKQFYRASKLLSHILEADIPAAKPVVGANAFAHEAGIHQHGIMANPLTYEIMRPEDVGIHVNRIIMGKHSGKAALRERLSQLGYTLSDTALDDVFKRFKELADRKKNINDMDIEELVYGETAEAQSYTLQSFVINSGTDITATAVVRLLHGGKVREHVARGETPVIAAFKAVDKIVKRSYPLHNWTINSISEGRTSLGESVVQVLSGERVLTGRGTHTDIVEACIRAYLSAINKALKLDA